MPEELKIIDGQEITIYSADSFKNFAANLGTGRDKNSYGQFVQGEDFSRNRQAADDLYRYQWMAKIIDIPAYDMTREWRTWSSVKATPQQIKDITRAEKLLNYQFKIQEAITWGGLYGGCAVILSVDGHGDASTPLDVTKIQKGQLKKFYVVDRHRIFPFPSHDQANPFGPNEGEPDIYNVLGSQQNIHASRIVKFEGKKLPYWERIRNLWWGDSMFNRLFDTMRNNKTVTQSIASLIHETNVDVISAEGLANALAADCEKVTERYSLMALMKSINGMLLLDGTETYDRKQTSFQALPQIQDQFLKLLSAASDIPATRLLGKSPDGQNSTGASDIRNYYDMVASRQSTDIMPQMDYLDQAMIRSLFGNYPEDLEWEYDSLWQMGETEQADIRLKDSQTMLNLQQLGVPDEAILNDIREGGLSSNLTEAMIKKYLAEVALEVENDDETEEILAGEPENEDE